MNLKVQKLDPSAKLPSYAYDGDAGMDLFSIEDVLVAPGEKVTIRTGLKFAIPPGHAGFVWDKSGLATKYHLKTMAGVIDSNYRGELMVVLINLGKEEYRVERGSKIAQMVIKPVDNPEIEEGVVDDKTERGEGGFGSSGIHEPGMYTQQYDKIEQVLSNNKSINRPTWDEYFMMAAKLIAVMATCPKLNVGTVIVKDRRIVASGFNGAPSGQPHCSEVGCLVFEDEGTSCRRIVHSEHNAVLQDSRNVAGGILYTPYLSCIDCMKAIISAGIREVVYEAEYQGHKNRYQMSREFALQAGVKLRKIPEANIIDILSKYYKGSMSSQVISEFI